MAKFDDYWILLPEQDNVIYSVSKLKIKIDTQIINLNAFVRIVLTIDCI